MSLIKKSNELVIPTTVKMMIYGQAGMGKSTVALSAPKPLLLDFDNGVKRMNMAHLENIDTVQVTSWSDVQQVLQEDLSAYQTIVVDTIGKMMDFIITYKCGSRQPSIKDWSGINAEFSYRTLQKEYAPYARFKAFREKKIYGCDSSRCNYYEETPFRPDLLLQELAALFHPGLFPDYRFRYYQPLSE